MNNPLFYDNIYLRSHLPPFSLPSLLPFSGYFKVWIVYLETFLLGGWRIEWKQTDTIIHTLQGLTPPSH